MQSRHLTQFYRAVQQWLEDSDDSHSVFNTKMGLCSNLQSYAANRDYCSDTLLEEIKQQFRQAGLDRLHPFNTGVYHYTQEADTNTLYQNKQRLQWIKDHAQ